MEDSAYRNSGRKRTSMTRTRLRKIIDELSYFYNELEHNDLSEVSVKVMGAIILLEEVVKPSESSLNDD